MKKKTKKILIAALIALAAVVLIVLAVVLLTKDGCGKDSQTAEPAFDYKTSDLSSYVSVLSSAYNGAAVEVTIDSVSEEDVDHAILKLLAKNKSETALTEAEKQVQEEFFARKLGAGDVLSIRYHGYYEEGGETVNFSGGNNMVSSASPLELGSGQFIVGFELGLVGADPASMRLKTVSVADATINDTAIISYTATMPDGKKQSGTTKAVILADADATFGDGFAAAVLGMAANATLKDQSFPLGEGSVTFEKIELHYFASGKVTPAVVDAYFPYSYGTADLAGKHVKFDVFLEDYTAYEAPEYNDAFVTDTLGVGADDLASYKGETLADKYRAYLRAGLEATREEKYQDLVYAALCDRYADVASFTGDLPAAAIDSAVKYLRVSFDSYINQQISYYANYYGYSLTYNEMVMLNYTDITSEEAIESYILSMLTEKAKESVKRDLAFYAVVRAVKAPTAEEFETLYEAKIRENIQSYMDYYGIKKSDYASEEEYEADYKELYDSLSSTYADSITKEIYWDYAKDELIRLTYVKVTDNR